MRKKADTCVFTVVYPGMEAWLPELADSLGRQDADAFDLLIVNDGLDPGSLEDLQTGFNCTILEPAGEIAANRLTGFRYLLRAGYTHTVFADADDRMPPDRVRISVQLLREFDIAVNDLDIMGAGGEIITKGFWSGRLKDMAPIHKNDLLNSNMIGLGNSSVRTSILEDLVLHQDIQALDWYLFTLLLYRGHRAVFTTRTSTHYRQHDANILGAGTGEMDGPTLKKWIRIKAAHYRALKGLSDAHRQKHAIYSELESKIDEPGVLAAHLASVSRPESQAESRAVTQPGKANPFWFERV